MWQQVSKARASFGILDTSRWTWGLRSLAAPMLAAAILGACESDVHLRGHPPDPDRLALIKPGSQTRSQVMEMLGSPTTVSPFDGRTIYYVSQRTRTVTYHEPETLSREVVAISFDDSQRVAEVKTYTLADGRPIEPVARETPTPGREFTLMQQLLGNLGRFETPDSSQPGL